MTRSLILECAQCHRATLQDVCPSCGGKTKNPLPPKYSPEDAYGEYRRRLKKLDRAQKEAA